MRSGESRQQVQIYLKMRFSNLPDMCVKWLADKKRIARMRIHIGNSVALFMGAGDAGSLVGHRSNGFDATCIRR